VSVAVVVAPGGSATSERVLLLWLAAVQLPVLATVVAPVRPVVVLDTRPGPVASLLAGLLLDFELVPKYQLSMSGSHPIYGMSHLYI